MGARKRHSPSHAKIRQGRTKYGNRGNTTLLDKQRTFAADVSDIVAKSQKMSEPEEDEKGYVKVLEDGTKEYIVPLGAELTESLYKALTEEDEVK